MMNTNFIVIGNICKIQIHNPINLIQINFGLFNQYNDIITLKKDDRVIAYSRYSCNRPERGWEMTRIINLNNEIFDGEYILEFDKEKLLSESLIIDSIYVKFVNYSQFHETIKEFNFDDKKYKVCPVECAENSYISFTRSFETTLKEFKEFEHSYYESKIVKELREIAIPNGNDKITVTAKGYFENIQSIKFAKRNDDEKITITIHSSIDKWIN